MWIVRIENQEGYEMPYKVAGSYSLGDLLGALLQTFDGKVTVTVENKKEEQTND